MTHRSENPEEVRLVAQPRRRWLLGGFAVAAALGGFTAAWHMRKTLGEPEILDAGFWGLEFETPTSQRLHLHALRGKPLLVNFWATWCSPCIEELPLLNAFYRENAGSNWQVLGLALDEPSAVQRFLALKPLAFPIALAGASGLGISKSLGNPTGALPFTVVINADSQIIGRKMGRLSSADLRTWAAKG